MKIKIKNIYIKLLTFNDKDSDNKQYGLRIRYILINFINSSQCIKLKPDLVQVL